MDRFQEELDLEERFGNNEITTPEEFLEQLMQVYDLVNGSTGKEIFNGVILPGLLKKHGSDIRTAGLEALALLAEASFMPNTEVVDGFLNSWTAEKIAGSAIGPLDDVVATAAKTLQQKVAPEAPILGFDYSQLPVIVYTNDSSLNRKLWGNPVYKSAHATRSHQVTFTRMVMRKIPMAEFVFGAMRAKITSYKNYPVGYQGELYGQKFDMTEGTGPLIINHGILEEVGYRHHSDEQYSFVYITTPYGKRQIRARRKYGGVREGTAIIAIFAILPKHNYEDMAKSRFSGIEQFIMGILPENLKGYLTQGDFFSKPRMVGMINGNSPDARDLKYSR